MFSEELPSVVIEGESISFLKKLPSFIGEKPFQEIIIPRYTVEQASDMATEYQYQWFDQMGTAYILNAKLSLYNLGITGGLGWEMIYAIERFIQNIWSKYDDYKLAILRGEDVVVDYSVVGEPPCKFKDLQWVLDLSYRAKEPNRIVNQDINFYINYN